ncbi:MAG: PspC domain-containing protein [Ignavibacteriae bacterium]|nr:PspC domain-containing protein [Ignavibacteria bacterium]MBI3364956.1 PspC domain-containing protein [Ignavibacteriota bacterium]
MTRLYRSETNKKIAGICGGIGEMLNADPTIVRLIAVLLLFITGIIPLLVTYLIAWWIVPLKKEGTNGAHQNI